MHVVSTLLWCKNKLSNTRKRVYAIKKNVCQVGFQAANVMDKYLGQVTWIICQCRPPNQTGHGQPPMAIGVEHCGGHLVGKILLSHTINH